MNPDYVNKVLSLRWRRLPPEVQDQAKRCCRLAELIDTLEEHGSADLLEQAAAAPRTGGNS